MSRDRALPSFLHTYCFDPHLVAHLIAESSRVLCAAPAYLERRGAPASIAELSQHDCLVLRDSNQAFGVWRLTGPNGSEKVRGWAGEGHGIPLSGRQGVHAELEVGRRWP